MLENGYTLFADGRQYTIIKKLSETLTERFRELSVIQLQFFSK